MTYASRDYPGSLSYDEITVIQERGTYKIATAEGEDFPRFLPYILIVGYTEGNSKTEYAFCISDSDYKEIIESDFDKKVTDQAYQSKYFRDNPYIFRMSK